MRVLAGVLLAIGLFISVQPVEARTITVFGDSLSDWPNSYADQLNSPEIRIRNFAWGGLKQRDFTIPRHFSCNRIRGTEVILELGTNDATEGRPMQYARGLKDALQALEARKCTVYLVMAVQWTDHPRVSKTLRQIRQVQRTMAAQYDNVILVDLYYDRNELVDAIHPNQYLHSLMAQQFRELLGE